MIMGLFSHVRTGIHLPGQGASQPLSDSRHADSTARKLCLNNSIDAAFMPFATHGADLHSCLIAPRTRPVSYRFVTLSYYNQVCELS